MSELLKRTDRLWSGAASTADPDYHPFSGLRILEQLAPGVAFFKAFVNVTAVDTGVHAVRAAVYLALMQASSLTMSRGIYAAAAGESEGKAAP